MVAGLPPAGVALASVLVVAVAGLLVAEYRGSIRGKWLTKPVASAAFVVLALTWGALETGYGRTILAGLALAAAGDILLIPGTQRSLRAGIGVFLFAHVAYIVAFSRLPIAPALGFATGIGLTIVGWSVLAYLRPRIEPPLRLAVATYVVVITWMVALAAGATAGGAPPTVAAGATLFYLSDLAFAAHRFVQPRFLWRLVGLPLYYAGQALLAASAIPKDQ